MGIFDFFRGKQKRELFPNNTENVRFPLLFPADKNPTVAACIDKISKTIAKLPLRVYERTDDGLRVANNHNLYFALEDPSTEETPTMFYSTMIRFLYHKGNAYLFKIRGSNDRIVGFTNIDPRKQVLQREGYPSYPIPRPRL